MHLRALVGLATGAILLLAACSSSAATTAPSGGRAACSESADAGAVAVAIKGLAFGPADISAKVGQVIAFSNSDSRPHTATLDDGSCSTGTISPGASNGLVFTVAGSYPFYCKIHPAMKGTITVS